MGTPAVRVLHIATRYRRGGSEQRIRDIVAALDDCDHVVIVGDDSDLELARPSSRPPSTIFRRWFVPRGPGPTRVR